MTWRTISCFIDPFHGLRIAASSFTLYSLCSKPSPDISPLAASSRSAHCFSRRRKIFWAPADKFKPKVIFTEKYAEKVYTDEDGFHFQDVVPEKLSVSVTANFTGVDLTAFDGDTDIDLTIGGFEFSAALGDDPTYAVGKKKATFPLTAEVDTPSGDTMIKSFGSVKVSWTAKKLTVKVTCTNLAMVGYEDLAASNFVGLAEVGEKVDLGEQDESVDVSIAFGDLAGNGTSALKGNSKTTLKKFGREDDDDYEEFELPAVTVIAGVFTTDDGTPGGGGAHATVTGQVTTPPDANLRVDAAGTIRGLDGAVITSITLQGSAASTTAFSVEPADDTGTQAWSITGLQLVHGKNAVIIQFTGIGETTAAFTLPAFAF